MHTGPIDLVLFTTFLGANLVLGLISGRRVTSFRSYAVGDKNFSTATLTSTVIATWIGGGSMFYILKGIYTTGWDFFIALSGASICLLLTGQVLAVRMGEFLDKYTVAEAMGDLFGKTVRVIAGFSGIAAGIGDLAMQFKVMGKILAFLFDLQTITATVIAASIVILYSAFGGVRSVTITDVFQFITFAIFVPVLSLIIWNNIKAPDRVVETLTTNPIFSLPETVSSPAFVGTLTLFSFYLVPSLRPYIFQRIAMARDLQQARAAFTYAAGVHFLIMVTLGWISVLLVADNANLDVNNLPLQLISRYAYPGLKGLIAVGISAMAMSTADSILNSISVILVHDIVKSTKTSLTTSITPIRVTAILFGVAALLLGFCFNDLLGLVLRTSSFYMPIVAVPFLLAIFGFRSSQRAVLIGILGGVGMMFVWQEYFAHTGIHDLMPSVFANLVFYMGSHYLLREKGGWVGIKKSSHMSTDLATRSAWYTWITNLRHAKPLNYLERNLPQKEGLYSLFGLYVIGATYASFFTVPEAIVGTYSKLYDFIAHSVLIITAGFLTYPAWPSTFRSTRFMTFMWPLGIFYTLFLVGGMLVVMSGFHQVQLMIFMLNVVMAALFVSWPIVVALSMSGGLISHLIFSLQGYPTYGGGALSSPQFKIIYAVLLFSSFLIALLQFKQQAALLSRRHKNLLRDHEHANDNLIKALHHQTAFMNTLNTEGVQALNKIADLGEDVEKKMHALNASLPKDLLQSVRKLQHKLRPAANYLQLLTQQVTTHMRLHVTRVQVDVLLREVLDLVKHQEIPATPYIVVQKLTQQNLIACDVSQIQQLLINAIIHLQKKHMASQTLLLGVEKTTLGYVINAVPGHTKKVSAFRFTITTDTHLPPLESVYLGKVDSPNLCLPRDEADLLIRDNQRVVGAHYGYTSITSTAHMYVIPTQIREVRPQEMDLPELEIGMPLSSSMSHYPGAAEQEAHLLKAIKSQTHADLDMVRKAIDLIKKYHGAARRKTGEPFYLHPIAVAQIVLNFTKDEATILGALLHDVVEDTMLSLTQLALIFNTTVSHLVNSVTHFDTSMTSLNKVKLASYENTQQILEENDVRVLHIKLADRLHNMRTLEGHAELAKRRHIAEETLQFFVPMAMQLGLTQVVDELRKLCHATLRTPTQDA